MNRLLKPEEVAERLAVSPKMIRAWLRDGKLPGIRLGRLWRVDPEALERFIREGFHEEKPAQKPKQKAPVKPQAKPRPTRRQSKRG